MSSTAQSKVTKQQEKLPFSQKYTPINLPGRHNWRPFTGADYRPPIQFLKLTSKQAIYLHG